MLNRYRNKDARARRKAGADVRKEAHDKLTTQQKLDAAVGKKERARLEQQLKKAKVVPTVMKLTAEQLAELEGDAIVFASNPKHMVKKKA
jgi:ribosomal protein S4